MTGSPSADRVLLVLLVVAVGLDLVRLARREPADPVDRVLTGGEALAAHLVMNVVMVVMLTPWWSTPVRTAALVVVTVLAVVFTALLVASLRVPSLAARRPAHGYHLVAAAAMVLAVALMDTHDAAYDTAHGAMGHQVMAHAPPSSTALTVTAAVLAAVFVLDLVATVLVVAAAPRAALVHAGAGGGADERSRITRLRVAVVPHAVMDVGMAAMLVALL